MSGRDPDFPAGPAPNAHGLVSARWLAANRGPGVVVLEVSWAKLTDAKEYLAGHVPGAVHLDTDEFEDGYPTWKLRPLAELREVIGRLGITRETTVVVYGRQSIAAARAWWVLMYAGVADVRLLDGGYAAWQRFGFDDETAINTPTAAVFEAEPRTDFLASTEYVEARLADGAAWIADVRSAEEFAGDVSGYDYLDARGRIPGAIHCGDADDGAHIYLKADGTLRGLSEIQRRWQAAGIRTTGGDAFEREVIFSCGSGWRSSMAFFCAWLLGYRNIRNYSDGWCGWSTVYVPDAEAGGSTPGWRQTRRVSE